MDLDRNERKQLLDALFNMGQGLSAIPELEVYKLVDNLCTAISSGVGIESVALSIDGLSESVDRVATAILKVAEAMDRSG